MISAPSSALARGNNQPLHTFEGKSFQRIIQYANPAAEQALWVSHNSILQFVMHLFDHMKPLVRAELSSAVSEVHIALMAGPQKVANVGSLVSLLTTPASGYRQSHQHTETVQSVQPFPVARLDQGAHTRSIATTNTYQGSDHPLE